MSEVPLCAVAEPVHSPELINAWAEISKVPREPRIVPRFTFIGASWKCKHCAGIFLEYETWDNSGLLDHAPPPMTSIGQNWSMMREGGVVFPGMCGVSVVGSRNMIYFHGY